MRTFNYCGLVRTFAALAANMGELGLGDSEKWA